MPNDDNDGDDGDAGGDERLSLNTRQEPLCQASCQQGPRLPGNLAAPGISLLQMREARINGVSQPVQGHVARKWQSWGLSCLPVLSYSESRNPRHLPQAYMHTLCSAPAVGACALEAACLRSVVRGMGWGVRGGRVGGGVKEEPSPPTPPPAQGGNKELPEAFNFKTAFSQFRHMNRNLFIAI